MKNIISIRTSSVFSICIVKRGGIKKKFHINALREQPRKIGPIPMNIANIETAKSRMKETD